MSYSNCDARVGNSYCNQQRGHKGEHALVVVKHIPGPWHYQEESDAYTHIVRTESNRLVVQLRQDTSGTEEANARLIATAPELLEFVRTMKDEANCVCKGKIGEIQRFLGTNIECFHCKAEALIAKAEGR
jgi:hypothetical protein